MNFLNPIFTEKRHCQDCYKCVRNCPVKAIKIEGGCATVIPELCIFCGNCVTVCPNDAKKVRDDLQPARKLLAMRQRVYVSLAPSWVSAFPGVASGQITRALRMLGFAGVSETALGAQQVSAHVAEMMKEDPARVLISSACPAVVLFLQRHKPELAAKLTPVLSPALTHAKMLRQLYGPEIGVVFVSPCIAKKTEADQHGELLDVALTFADLRQWLEQEKIEPAALAESDGDRFVPEPAEDGAIYAVDGGMVAGIRANCPINDCDMMAFSGISAIQKALSGIEDLKVDQSLLLELLACEGGCVNGPRLGRNGSTVAKRYALLRGARYEPRDVPRRPTMPIESRIAPQPPLTPRFSDAQVREALRVVGKLSSDDELNCGGCGYDSCREFGQALLANKAERSMCVTYMRQLAHKKANALIQKMPSAVVIVDAELRIVEHNAAFARLLNGHGRVEGDEASRWEGADLKRAIPFHRLFAGVLRTGEDIHDKDIRHRDTILHVSIFTIEKHCVVGGILQDITKPAVQKEQVINKAQEVIKRNLETVQKIAYLLGENASESEITLNSIIESFLLPAAEKTDKPDDTGAEDDWRKRYRR